MTMILDARQHPYVYPKAVIRWTQEEIDELLVWTTNLEASDVTLSTGKPIWAEIHGVQYPVTGERVLSQSELMTLVNRLYGGDNAASHVSGGEDLDFAHTIRVDRDTRLRFRVNAVGTRHDGSLGLSITLRSLPGLPPLPEEIGLEPEILQACDQHQGMILVTGGTGSGKSTTLACIIRQILRGIHGPKKILTYEAPIEFVYDGCECRGAFVDQSDIGWGRNLPTFEGAVRNALRRKPSIILVGECRDRETMAAAVEASNTGHLMFTTVHTNSVSETFHRITNLFPIAERDGQSVALAQAMQGVITQNLVRTTDGKRAALREFLFFDDELRFKLLDTPNDRWPIVVRQMVHEHGRPMIDAARALHAEGRISDEVLKRYDKRAMMFARGEEG